VCMSLAAPLCHWGCATAPSCNECFQCIHSCMLQL
jgi:hypothetical protein